MHRMHVDEMRRILAISKRDMFNIEAMLKSCGAYWKYTGQPGEPHCLLTSNKHSDAYYNVSKLLQYPNFRRLLAGQLAVKLTMEGIRKIDVVISSSYAAFSIGQALADEIGAVSFFTEKVDGKQKWTKRFEIPEEARVLQVEELSTTMKTTLAVKKTVIDVVGDDSFEFAEHKGKPLVATLIHRPGKLPIEYPEYSVISLHERVVHNWEPGECPICEKSEAIKPKENWDTFLKYVHISE